MDSVIGFLDSSTEEIVNKANLKGKVIVAIDFHEREYYGDKNGFWIVGGKYKNGTCWFIRHATVEIISRRKRICLGAVPIHNFSNTENVVKVLMERVLKYVKEEKIELVMLDRGFFSGYAIRLLNEMGIDFLMPAKNTPKIIKLKESVYGYEMNKSKFNLIIKGKKKWCTSLDEIPKRLARIYKWRWRIETGYRTKKRNFRINTTTPNIIIRTLFFFVEILAYNLWILANVVPTMVNGAIEIVRELKRISTKLFKKKILGIS